LLREESERVSELKSISGTGKLPYGTLALGTEGIKDAIQGFDDAKKADIENERVPPELIDPESEEGRNISNPTTPPEYEDEGPETAGTGGFPFSSSHSSTPTTPISPGLADPARLQDVLGSLPGTPTGGPHRRGHARQSSLGTTMTSPSTRRRSIESTRSLLREAVDGKIDDGDLKRVADQISSPTSPSGRGHTANGSLDTATRGRPGGS